MSISGVNQSQHAQHMHDTRELEALGKKDQTAAGILAGNNSTSYYEGGIQFSPNGNTMPIAAALPGSAQALATMDTNDLQAMLQGVKAENQETIHKMSEEAALTRQEQLKTARDEKIQQMSEQLDGASTEQKDQCATAKIVLGALLLPVGAILIADGARDKKEVAATTEARGQLMEGHYGQNWQALDDFQQEYALDSAVALAKGEPVDQLKHLNTLNGLKDEGTISEDLYQDLEAMVLNGESADVIADRLLADAVVAYVDGQIPSMDKVDNLAQKVQEIQGTKVSDGDIKDSIDSAESDLADAKATLRNGGDDFQAFLAQLAQTMEGQDEALRKVQENLKSAANTAISGQQSAKSLQSMLQTNI